MHAQLHILLRRVRQVQLVYLVVWRSLLPGLPNPRPSYPSSTLRDVKSAAKVFTPWKLVIAVSSHPSHSLVAKRRAAHHWLHPRGRGGHEGSEALEGAVPQVQDRLPFVTLQIIPVADTPVTVYGHFILDAMGIFKDFHASFGA